MARGQGEVRGESYLLILSCTVQGCAVQDGSPKTQVALEHVYVGNQTEMSLGAKYTRFQRLSMRKRKVKYLNSFSH